MMSHTAFHADFTHALRDPALPPPAFIRATNAHETTRRFAVYRNNVATSLIDALRTRFPAAERIVGEEFFIAMARVFIVDHPPHSPLMFTYGDDLPAFVETFEHTRDMPYLADVMRIEAARTLAYHAADARPLAPHELAHLDPEALMQLRASLHPSLKVLASSHPIVTIWSINSEAEGDQEIGEWESEEAMICRPHLDVEVRLAPPGTSRFVEVLRDNATLAQAAQHALDMHHAIDLTATLACLFQAGAFTSLD